MDRCSDALYTHSENGNDSNPSGQHNVRSENVFPAFYAQFSAQDIDSTENEYYEFQSVAITERNFIADYPHSEHDDHVRLIPEEDCDVKEKIPASSGQPSLQCKFSSPSFYDEFPSAPPIEQHSAGGFSHSDHGKDIRACLPINCSAEGNIPTFTEQPYLHFVGNTQGTYPLQPSAAVLVQHSAASYSHSEDGNHVCSAKGQDFDMEKSIPSSSEELSLQSPIITQTLYHMPQSPPAIEQHSAGRLSHSDHGKDIRACLPINFSAEGNILTFNEQLYLPFVGNTQGTYPLQPSANVAVQHSAASYSHSEDGNHARSAKGQDFDMEKSIPSSSEELSLQSPIITQALYHMPQSPPAIEKHSAVGFSVSEHDNNMHESLQSSCNVAQTPPAFSKQSRVHGTGIAHDMSLFPKTVLPSFQHISEKERQQEKTDQIIPMKEIHNIPLTETRMEPCRGNDITQKIATNSTYNSDCLQSAQSMNDYEGSTQDAEQAIEVSNVAVMGKTGNSVRIACGSEQNFKCEDCDKTFTSKWNLKRHSKKAHPERIFECGNSAKMAKRPEKKFKCDDCGKTFTRNQNLIRHSNRAHQERIFECRICGQKFFALDRLKLHKLDHKMCHKCDFRARDSWVLRRHMAKHF